MDPRDSGERGIKQARENGSWPKRNQEVNFSRNKGTMKYVFRGIWRPSDLGSRESTQQGTLAVPITCVEAIV
jgi:hypothetical protein